MSILIRKMGVKQWVHNPKKIKLYKMLVSKIYENSYLQILKEVRKT